MGDMIICNNVWIQGQLPVLSCDVFLVGTTPVIYDNLIDLFVLEDLCLGILRGIQRKPLPAFVASQMFLAQNNSCATLAHPDPFRTNTP